jgi:S1-C subfamily serine protease
MDGLDLVLIVVCLGFGLSGYRQGFLVGVMSFVGFLGGGVLGAKYAGWMHAHLGIALRPALFGLLAVAVGAVVGQTAATVLGTMVRREIRWQPLRMMDSFAGSAVSVISVLLIAWLVGTALAHSSPGGVSRQVRGSVVLQGVDDVMPASTRTWFGSFRRLLDEDGLPEVFGGIGPDDVVPVAPPNPRLANSPTVETARPSVVKITGDADSCSRELEGSGFIYAADHVMTNAHVVAGVFSPTVHTASGRNLPAHVVLYDPKRDVAVLYVPGLGGTSLAFGGPLARGRSAIVLGFPQDGPFDARAARVRLLQQARGPDIYQDREVTREIYSLYALVRPGNSGGPLLTPGGKVAGVVFAAAVDNSRTGYALTAAEVAPDATAGESAVSPVSTQGCD